jgi:hypothetical protein
MHLLLRADSPANEKEHRIVSNETRCDEIAAALNAVQRERELMLRRISGAARAFQMAVLWDREALLWEQVWENAKRPVEWRSALAARELARQQARAWRDIERQWLSVTVPIELAEVA